MRWTAPLLALAALGGCTMEPHFERPPAAVPRAWPVGDAYPRQLEDTLPTVSYGDIFRDHKLQAIIGQALSHNQDLAQALANVESARALYRVGRADLFPEIDAEASLTERGSADGGQTSRNYLAQARLPIWEIDLFGRLRSLSNSNFRLYLGQQAAARSIRLSLVAEVAAAYLQLAADRSVLAITRDTLRAAESSVAVTKVRLDGGIAPRTDLRQAETVLATAQANEVRAVTAVAQDRNALELLVGGSVADALLPPSIEAVEGQVGELPAGLDSAILLRRPDVAQAEYQLWSANARIGAARAAFLPRISLTSVLGFASAGLSGLFDGEAKSWTATPQVTLPIFDGGANSGNLAYAKAQQAVYLAGYEKAIQAAFRDVADALARRGTIEPELAADRRNLGAAEDSHTLVEARYHQGIDPYLSVLDAQRTLYAAQLRLVSSRLSRVQNLVDLYRSLGGDQTLDVATDTSGTAH